VYVEDHSGLVKNLCKTLVAFPTWCDFFAGGSFDGDGQGILGLTAAGCILAALLCLTPLRAEESLPRVLIINSYHPGYGWSDGEMHGLLNVLNHRFPRLVPSIEYLDWRRFPQPEREPQLLESLEQKSGGQPFDIIITLDDPALNFVFKFRNNLGAATPVIFGGINHYTPETVRGQTNVTGVAESTDMAGTLDLMLRLQPATREVVAIYDENESAWETRKILEDLMPHYTPRLRIRFLHNWSVAGLMKALGELKPGTVALLLSATKDAEGKLISDDTDFVLELKERCPVPVYLVTPPLRPLFSNSNWENDTWAGLGGSLLSSDLHGEAVGGIALRVLSGEKAGEIPVMTKSPTRLAVDYQQMQRFHLPLSALPEGTEVFHRPASYFEVYRAQIIGVGLVISLLSGTVLVLSASILRRRRAESALRQSNERFQLIAQATNDAVWDWKPDTGEMWWNDSYLAMLGKPAGAAPSFEAWTADIHPEDRERVTASLRSAVAGVGQTWVSEYRYRRSDGADGFVFTRACFLRDAGGRAVRALGAMTDVTAQKQTEQKLRRLAAAVEQATELIIVLDLQGAIEYVNPAFVQSTGFLPVDALGQPFWFLFESESEVPPFTLIAQRIQETGSWIGRHKWRKKNGSVLSGQLVISAIRDQNAATVNFVLLARDVTQELKLEEQVRFAQKMEAIGLLAGGVAHDFNNILQIILGHTQLALEFDLSAAERREGLQFVKEAAERAMQLTRQLLVFGRKQPLLMEDVDPNQLVADLLKMVRRLIGEHIAVDFVPGIALGNIRVNKGQMEQVLLNLCVNARDAMPQGGRLTIELENVSFDSEYCEAHPWARPGRYLLMGVTDTGSGMDPATLARAFDPFFTTKPKEKGTGLGLSVVYGIIQQHDGLIDVRSEAGAGTTFKIYLPTVERVAGAAGGKSADAPAPGTGTILLVEDEDAVRKLATKVLERGGYRVLSACDGREAVDIFRLHSDEISLLMLDAVMPNMGGREAYERIAAMRPGIPVLFCSGYSADVLQPGFALRPEMQLVQKPYLPDEILRRIHGLLNHDGTSSLSGFGPPGC
jgi:PAS domain S-box-containing protein